MLHEGIFRCSIKEGRLVEYSCADFAKLNRVQLSIGIAANYIAYFHIYSPPSATAIIPRLPNRIKIDSVQTSSRKSYSCCSGVLAVFKSKTKTEPGIRGSSSSQVVNCMGTIRLCMKKCVIWNESHSSRANI